MAQRRQLIQPQQAADQVIQPKIELPPSAQPKPVNVPPPGQPGPFQPLPKPPSDVLTTPNQTGLGGAGATDPYQSIGASAGTGMAFPPGAQLRKPLPVGYSDGPQPGMGASMRPVSPSSYANGQAGIGQSSGTDLMQSAAIARLLKLLGGGGGELG